MTGRLNTSGDAWAQARRGYRAFEAYFARLSWNWLWGSKAEPPGAFFHGLEPELSSCFAVRGSSRATASQRTSSVPLTLRWDRLGAWPIRPKGETT
jgi:hypothetical protein